MNAHRAWPVWPIRRAGRGPAAAHRGRTGHRARPRALPPVPLALSAAVALAAGVRNDSPALSSVDAATAFVCAALLRYIATEGPAHTARRTRPAVS
ncbi:hypothetical protein [Streptomyces hebeiensis]|uniref:hypothetical protein n=1 Tax=Streptomyces hebeiensis TaxID=229486 RepID=UPI0031DBD8DF